MKGLLRKYNKKAGGGGIDQAETNWLKLSLKRLVIIRQRRAVKLP